LEASLQTNEYALAAARAKLDYTLIRAPFSGAIQRLDTEIGELAAPGKVLLELVATRPLKAVFSVPQKDLAEIREGMEVRLIVPSLDKTITSRIDHIYPALDSGTRNATFDVRLPDHDAIVIMAKFDRALVLPRSAVHIREADTGVYTVEKNVARWRPVTIGQAEGRQVRIVSGLKGGETVIVTPDPRLQDGGRVQPRNNWRTAP